VDSDDLSAFDDVDRIFLEKLCGYLGRRFGEEAEALIKAA